jgi:hypothetical protein
MYFPIHTFQKEGPSMSLVELFCDVDDVCMYPILKAAQGIFDEGAD